MKNVIVGASAGLGRALAEELASRGHTLMLVASDPRDLDALANDLRLRFAIDAKSCVVDLRHFDTNTLYNEVIARMGEVDALFLVAGFGDDADCGPISNDLVRTLTEINYTAPVMIANAFINHLTSRPQGHIIGIGSVAAMRGRASNMIYGASKRGLEFYFEALRIRLEATSCRVQFYRAGFMATTMYKGKKGLLVADPASVARRIADRLGGAQGLAYMPSFWSAIGFILCSLPYTVFRRLKI